MIKETQAYLDGRKAFRDSIFNRMVPRNPYKEVIDRSDWSDGFMDSMDMYHEIENHIINSERNCS